jgi:hypothetical protein
MNLLISGNGYLEVDRASCGLSEGIWDKSSSFSFGWSCLIIFRAGSSCC